MSRRRSLLTILLTPAVIVALGVAATTTAAAGGNGGGYEADEVPWSGTSICATGTLTVAGIETSAVALTGLIQPCAGTNQATADGARWAMAKYTAGVAYVDELSVGRFGSATAPTAFSARVGVNTVAGATSMPFQAACLVTAATTRLACVEITLSDGALHVAPLSASDTRVKFAVVVRLSADGDPECAGCA